MDIPIFFIFLCVCVCVCLSVWMASLYFSVSGVFGSTRNYKGFSYIQSINPFLWNWILLYRKGVAICHLLLWEMIIFPALLVERYQNENQENYLRIWVFIPLFRTSLVVQWWRILLPMQGTWAGSLVRELRSHKLLEN